MNGQIIFINEDNADLVEPLLYDLSGERYKYIDGIYCIECKERTRFKYSEIYAECCGEHTGVECTNCRERFDSVGSYCKYNDIQEFNMDRLLGFNSYGMRKC